MNLLSPLGWFYGQIMDLRNKLFDRDILKIHALGAPTISVGNLTAGGTGKTPVVGLIAEILIKQGEKVCILTRGYGRRNPNSRILVSDGNEILADAAVGGDEPVELARRLNGKAIIVADPDRNAAAAWAIKEFAVTVFILDDGFQHRQVKRDLDIVCIDATDPFGGNAVLPAGRLRESVKGLERADALIITRADLSETVGHLAAQLRQVKAHARIFTSTFQFVKIVELDEFVYRIGAAANVSAAGHLTDEMRSATNETGVVRLAAFCGLGNPDAFFSEVLKLSDIDGQIDLVKVKAFSDHYSYRQDDINALINEGKHLSIDAYITTAKDAVKLGGIRFRKPCFVAVAETVIDNAEEFRNLVSSFGARVNR